MNICERFLNFKAVKNIIKPSFKKVFHINSNTTATNKILKI
ncbi:MULTISPECIES: hypothetical protein [Campylobacter]|nr:MULTISPECIES: hypothetical protein [Campylobacter]MDD7421912.1 hypothetical protein [Campylobacter hominis]MDY3117467.1 hypothetical protein [Campylobacter hominis]